MAITAETFESEHFDKLLRGIDIAHEAFDEREREINKLEAEKEHLDDLVDLLRNEVADLRAQLLPVERLMEFIGDIERGIRTVDELFELARELGGVHA